MEGKVPQCQDHRQERSQSNGSWGGGGWDGGGAGFLVCNLHFGLFERQTLGCTGCGGDVRLCHSQTCGVCVCGEWVGGVREREREEGDRRAAVEQQRGTKERGKRENFPGGPVVRVPHFHCGGQGWILGWELRFLQPLSLGQLKERKELRTEDGSWKCLQFGSAICPPLPSW